MLWANNSWVTQLSTSWVRRTSGTYYSCVHMPETYGPVLGWFRLLIKLRVWTVRVRQPSNTSSLFRMNIGRWTSGYKSKVEFQASDGSRRPVLVVDPETNYSQWFDPARRRRGRSRSTSADASRCGSTTLVLLVDGQIGRPVVCPPGALFLHCSLYLSVFILYNMLCKKISLTPCIARLSSFIYKSGRKPIFWA